VTVVVEDLLEQGEERAEDGLGSWLVGVKGGRLRVPDNLLDGPEVEGVLGAGLSQADLAGQDTSADLGPGIHVGEHSGLPQSGSRAPLRLAAWQLRALHFWIGTALHFSIGIHRS
jgi:hypothetical protein